jgi:nucleoside-diphosphate kinase
MSGNITFTMIKPDAVKKNYIGAIMADITKAGFEIVALKMVKLTKAQAESFYAIHKEKGFFDDMTGFMSSGHIVAAILKKSNAIEDFRKLIGATNPEKAEEGTIRKKYAESIDHNAVHGSDSDENAIIESNFFFSSFEKFGA